VLSCVPFQKVRSVLNFSKMMLQDKGYLTLSDFPTFLDAFLSRYQTEFGFVLKDRAILVDDVRVRGVGKTEFMNSNQQIDVQSCTSSTPEPIEFSKVFFESKYLDTAVFR